MVQLAIEGQSKVQRQGLPWGHLSSPPHSFVGVGVIPHSVSFCLDSFKEFRVFPYIVTYAKKSGFHPFVFQNCQHLWSHLRHATIIKRQIDYFSVCFLPPSNPSVTHLHPSRYLIFQHTIYPLYQPNFTIFYKDSANRKQNKINLFIFYAEVQFIIFEDGVRRAKNLLFLSIFPFSSYLVPI